MFDVKKVTENIIKFIQDYYKKYHLKGAVIGISGGKDSAVVAGLFAKALKGENVIGLWLPCHSNEKEKLDAMKVSKTFGFQLIDFDLTNIYDNYVKQIKETLPLNDEDMIDANINIKPRMRTATLYYYAAVLSKVKQGTYLVAGTSNKDELFVGYFTKGGDDVSDIMVLADLTVDEVVKIGDYIGVPYEICHKTPDDGLSGKTDEEKLGVKYSEITEVIKEEEQGIKSNLITSEIRDKVLKLHFNNQHKFNIPTFKK